MRALLLRPDPRGVRTGNRLTALRWAALWRSIGIAVRVRGAARADEDRAPADVVVGLHAAKCARAFTAALASRPGARGILAWAGTEGLDDAGIPVALTADARRALDAAATIVLLQPRQAELVPAEHRARTTVVLPSARALVPRAAPAERRAEVVVLGHLRPVKDPFAVPAAMARLREGALTAVHLGAALDEAARVDAERWQRASPRWRWLGPAPRREALARLAAAWALVLPSRREGAAGALIEALVHGVPVLASAIPANTALLGDDWPALFPAGDVAALAELLQRLEDDAAWRGELDARAAALAPRFTPAREREDWRRLLLAVPR